MPPKRKGSSTKEASQESEPKRQKSKGKSPKAAKSTEEKDAALAEVRATLLRRVSSSRRPQPSQAFKVISWNVNGLRAVLAKAGKLKSLVESEDPCVLCLQEIKLDGSLHNKLEQENEEMVYLKQRYRSIYHCADKKGYAGVAVFSKEEPLSITRGLGDLHKDLEGRVLTCEFDKFFLVNVYVPNSGLKLERLKYRTEEWDPAFHAYIKGLPKPVIVTGDLNVAHGDDDVADPKKKRNKVPGFCDMERANFGELVGGNGSQPHPLPDEVKAKRTLMLGRPGPPVSEDRPFVDVQQILKQMPPSGYEFEDEEGTHYTYWSYKFDALAKSNGWRLDYFLLSRSLIPLLKKYFGRHDLWGISDHVPIGLELNVPKLTQSPSTALAKKASSTISKQKQTSILKHFQGKPASAKRKEEEEEAEEGKGEMAKGKEEKTEGAADGTNKAKKVTEKKPAEEAQETAEKEKESSAESENEGARSQSEKETAETE